MFDAKHSIEVPGCIGGVDNMLSSLAIAGEASKTAPIDDEIIFLMLDSSLL
jgi:hypothetical protein